MVDGEGRKQGRKYNLKNKRKKESKPEMKKKSGTHACIHTQTQLEIDWLQKTKAE